MGRVIAVGPGGRAQAPARRDVCADVIWYVLDNQLLNQRLLSPVCATQKQAFELRRDLFRSARYFCSCGHSQCTRRNKNYPPDNGCPRGGQRISCSADVVLWEDPADGQGKIRVQFRMMDKREGIKAMIARYGPDPNSWPYFSRRKQLKGT